MIAYIPTAHMYVIFPTPKANFNWNVYTHVLCVRIGESLCSALYIIFQKRKKKEKQKILTALYEQNKAEQKYERKQKETKQNEAKICNSGNIGREHRYQNRNGDSDGSRQKRRKKIISSTVQLIYVHHAYAQTDDFQISVKIFHSFRSRLNVLKSIYTNITTSTVPQSHCITHPHSESESYTKTHKTTFQF